MSTTDTPPPADGSVGRPGPRISGEQARDLGRLRRTVKGSPEGRHIAGVAGGLARHLDIDPVLVRVALVVLVFFGGSGLLLYGAAWLFVPEEGSGHATVQLDDRNRAVALYVAAGVAALALLGDTIGRFDFPWPLAVVALVVLVVLGKRDRLRPAGPPAAAASPAGPAAYAAPAPAPGVESYDTAVAVDTSAATPGPAYVPGWTPPVAPPPYTPPRNPRRRGPVLFWFTLALIALLEGTLGILDAGLGLSVPDPAYAALAVGVTGAMLVLGAFWGRAGGLILVGLLATLALVASVAAQEYDGAEHRVHATPQSASDVRDRYDLDAGELVLDLTDVSDPTTLNGRTVDINGGVGKLTVVVPDGWGVGVEAHVGIGNITVLDSGDNGGFGVEYSAHRSAAAGQPDLRLDTHLGVGAIEVLDQDDYHPGSDR